MIPYVTLGFSTYVFLPSAVFTYLASAVEAVIAATIAHAAFIIPTEIELTKIKIVFNQKWQENKLTSLSSLI